MNSLTQLFTNTHTHIHTYTQSLFLCGHSSNHFFSRLFLPDPSTPTTTTISSAAVPLPFPPPPPLDPQPCVPPPTPPPQFQISPLLCEACLRGLGGVCSDTPSSRPTDWLAVILLHFLPLNLITPAPTKDSR